MARRIGFRDRQGDTRPDADTGGHGWEQYLDRDERILWEGRPDTAFALKATTIPLALFGMAFGGFALFWMIMASQAGGGFWAFGLIHFSVGVFMVLAALFGGPYKRARTWYALSTRRAFIATHMPITGRKLKSYPIDAATVLETDGGQPATIHFATQTRRRSKGGSYQVPIGFERIADGDEVYKLLRRVQRDQT